MKTKFIKIAACVFLLPSFISAGAQDTAGKAISAGSRVYFAPMPNDFGDYLRAAFQAKRVPLTIVEDKGQADFEITAQAESQKASTAKKVIMWDWRSNEQASIQVNNLKTGQAVYAYSVNKISSAHGRKSSAEACAKHLKEKIESGK